MAMRTLLTTALLLAALLSGCATPPRPSGPYVPQALGMEQRQAALQQVWSTIKNEYVDPQHNGVDWDAVGQRYRSELLRSSVDDAAFWRGLNRMAGELRDAHTSVRSPLEVNATVQQRGNFGLALLKLEGGWVMGGLSGASQAALLGVRPGHRLLQIDGQDIEAWWKVASAAVRGSSTDRSNFTLVMRDLNARPVGSTLVLTLQRPSTGNSPADKDSIYTVTLKQDPLSPVQGLLRTHLLASNLAYVRFATFNPVVMPELQASFKRMADAKGLVLDLRGNGGGSFKMAVDLMGWFMKEGGNMGEIVTRNNQRLTALLGLVDITPDLVVKPQAQPLNMPLAVLLDENSASASELLAGVLQDRGRARVFGTTSCGCLLGVRSGGLPLPGGGRLVMSQFDVRIGAPPGKRIEGLGVTPDEPVPWTVATLQGQRDVVFEAAQAWVMQQGQGQGAAQRPGQGKGPEAGATH